MQICVGCIGTSIKEIQEQINAKIKEGYNVVNLTYQKTHGEYYSYSALVIFERR